MLSYPNGIQLNNFQEAFARRFSFYFSFRDCGFKSGTEHKTHGSEFSVTELTATRGGNFLFNVYLKNHIFLCYWTATFSSLFCCLLGLRSLCLSSPFRREREIPYIKKAYIQSTVHHLALLIDGLIDKCPHPPFQFVRVVQYPRQIDCRWTFLSRRWIAILPLYFYNQSFFFSCTKQYICPVWFCGLWCSLVERSVTQFVSTTLTEVDIVQQCSVRVVTDAECVIFRVMSTSVPADSRYLSRMKLLSVATGVRLDAKPWWHPSRSTKILRTGSAPRKSAARITLKHIMWLCICVCESWQRLIIKSTTCNGSALSHQGSRARWMLDITQPCP